jgi:hypothetical protein
MGWKEELHIGNGVFSVLDEGRRQSRGLELLRVSRMNIGWPAKIPRDIDVFVRNKSNATSMVNTSAGASTIRILAMIVSFHLGIKITSIQLGHHRRPHRHQA